MSKQRSTPVTHSTLADDGFEYAFASGFSPQKGNAIPLIPREKRYEEAKRAQAEEREWWQGRSVPARLSVELPFWLMMPDGDISVTFDRATVVASIRGRYLEVSDGPMALNSHANVLLVGPGDDVYRPEVLQSVAPSQMPVCRPMKTVVLFQTEAIEDAFAAWRDKGNVVEDDHSGIRRVNRVMKYFHSLATAHIPFVNRLITSYRSVSFDPYAFEVSEWDVPVWYAECGETLVRIGLMPYWDNDTFPSLNDNGNEVEFHATTLEAVQSQAGSNVAAGKLEMLDADSLMYRGRFGDAVRSAVTAIEVALESQLASLLRDQGYSADQITRRIENTRNNFFARLADYEQLSGKRLPGPLLSSIPYINGVRLRGELDWVRGLRHRVVHEGIRVDVFSRGPTLRAIETMSWLFEWLSAEDEHGPEDNRNYYWFSALRGQIIYRFGYTDKGAVVRPLPHPEEGEGIVTADQMIFQQYTASLDEGKGDLDLFARMSFEFLGVECQDGPPEPANEPGVRERFVIRDGDRKAIVFCLEFDGLIDTVAAGAIVTRTLEYVRENGSEWRSLAIIHHQRHLDRRAREVDDAIPDDIQRVFDSCSVTAICALDLQLLVRHPCKRPDTWFGLSLACLDDTTPTKHRMHAHAETECQTANRQETKQ